MPAWTDTAAYFKIKRLKKRYRVVQGGTSAGKTYDITAMLADLSFDYPGDVFSLVTNSFPNLRRGMMRDLDNFIASQRWERYFERNKSEHTLTNRTNGAKIEFFSTDEMGALGARRDWLFVNEANRITYDTFTNLAIRTRKGIWIDFNPVNEFWAHTELLKRDDVDFLKLNYLDNEALEPEIIADLEARRGDGTSNWWRVYGLGEVGSLEGNVYEGWQVVDEVPEGYLLRCYGVDFGFANDPTAIVAIYENEDGALCLDEKLCQTKLLTPALVAFCKANLVEATPLVCDNARPEIIAEMQANGLRAIPCDKSPGEKMNGKRYNIELVQRRTISYTSRSKELEREFLTYQWAKKKSTGEMLNEPVDGNDHVADAISYGVRFLAKPAPTFSGIR